MKKSDPVHCLNPTIETLSNDSSKPKQGLALGALISRLRSGDSTAAKVVSMASAASSTSRVLRVRDPRLPVHEEDDYLESLLLDWAAWQRAGAGVDGYPEHSTGLSDGGASKSFDDMLETMDNQHAEVVETVINGLPPAQRCALHHAYLNAVYRFRNEMVYESALEQAKQAVRAGLRARNIYLGA